MPEFVIERTIPGIGDFSDAQMKEASQSSLQVLEGMGGARIKWLHSYVTGDKLYCVYFAADEATVREHGRLAGIPVDRVAAVRRLISPDTAK